MLMALVTSFLLSATLGQAAASEKRLEISEKNAKLLEHIGEYSDLEVLSISCVEGLQALPDSIGTLRRLKELAIDNGNGCSMNLVLPETIGNLRALERLTLYGAQDPSEPQHKTGGRHKFPIGMSQLKNLVYLDLGRNRFDEIPLFVKDLPRLRELRFEFNGLKEVPAFLSDLRELATLRLAGNDLRDLPDFLNTLPRLTRITLGNNCKITQNEAKMRSLRRGFPRVKFDFIDEYDCPAE